MIATIDMEIHPMKKTIFLLLFLHMIYTTAHPSIYHHHHPTILTDKAALLAFKAAMTQDTQAALANWRNSSNVCNFTGVVCNHRQHRVVELWLNRSGIHGLLSPFLSNLTGLLLLDLSENNLVGPIPPELGSLWRLNELNLFGNRLDGPIPDSLSLLSQLFYLDLKGNRLKGTIPTSILYNCTSLGYLDLSENTLHGEIPPEIGNHLSNLMFLQLYSNNLSGKLPPSLSNCTILKWLDVENNSFSGELPTEILGRWPLLELLHLSNNHFTSHDHNTNLVPFFTALSNCTHLQAIELAGMGLGGQLPTTIDRLGINLSRIYLQDNWIFGSIPTTIVNLSNLTVLNLSSNLLNGTIPDKIGQLQNLQWLILSNNSLIGPIPPSIGQINLLNQLDLSKNRLSGEVPDSLGNLIFLSDLFLQENKLSGISPSLGKCMSLNRLDVSFNTLTAVPKEIFGLTHMGIFLNLSHNFINEPLPSELSKMQTVQEIDLSSNHFHGNISPQLDGCIAAVMINFSLNSLEGKLPSALGLLRNLKSLDVSNNSLYGEIPVGLGDSGSLVQLNLSYNDFNGPIPRNRSFANFTYLSFLGNPKLCGSIPGVTPCMKKGRWWHSRKFKIIVSVVAPASALLLAVFYIIAFKKIKWKIVPRKADASSKSTPSLKLSFPRITYKELAEATAEFDQGRLIGTGSFGHVYRGVLKDGTIVAVKVLHLQTGNSTKSFNRECQVLKRIRHRNLMRIITACSLPEFKALVLPFMANGSLESHLYPASARMGSEPSDLELIQRVSICSDIAEGMAYLHHHSPVRVIHCDLKPSNVLLNDDMTALVSDFGIARLVMNVGGAGNGGPENVGNSTANMLSGSIGYIAPEYAYGTNTSTKGDVYSFGILVLEMVTRKRPTDDMFVGGLDLHKWVKRHYHGRVEKVIDSSLIRSARDQSPEVQKMWEVAIGELIELGVLCTQEVPSTRPTMLDAADDLDRLKRYLIGDTSATFASSLGISSSTIIGED
ncbi:putative leucine-rich repeat receptor-like serine/threonine-protein kinase At2g24130 [Magnolia sinica]|uniref:putative leucine-rich repeat receptor-like serine/threonine-protein kinase At2g24130 n=1 Tax=Magnolia sinica TaxID=86752 RepID=UPI002659F64C|nr:putative leucine-rich repeat receptor-like serine/threonine-protein kinase At2g24130 [Magnolia sinica]